MNSDYLRSVKFHNLLKDAELFPTSHPEYSEIKKRIDLIFYSTTRHQANMCFENFLKALVKVAEYRFNGEPSHTALKLLLDQFLLPLYERLNK